MFYSIAAGILLIGACEQKMELPVLPESDLAVSDSAYIIVDTWTGFAGIRDIFVGVDGIYVVDDLGLHRHIPKDGSRDDAFPVIGGDSVAGVFQTSYGVNYVVYRAGTVEWYSSAGSKLGDMRAFGIAAASSIVVDADTNIYVADSVRHVIQQYQYGFFDVPDSAKVLAGEGTGCRNVVQPAGMAIDPMMNVFVASTGQNWTNKIYHDPNEGCFNIGGNSQDGGRGDNLLLAPLDVSLDKAFNIYVADTGNRIVKKYSPIGIFIVDIGLTDDGGTVLGVPVAVAALEKFVYVADARSGSILVLRKPQSNIVGLQQ